jgi:hypothetical protein
MKSIFKITKSGLVFSGSSAEIGLARSDFEEHNWLRLPAILDRELWNKIQAQLAVSNIEDTESIYPQLSVSDSALLLLLNNPRLFAIIEQITGCDHIGCFRGHIYRVVPGESRQDEITHYQTDYEKLTGWHTDLNGTRMVALSINLNTEPYLGGVLSIREALTKRVLCELPNSGFGDAILFRINERLEHRVSDLEGTVPKTAFVGWFESEPDYRALLAEGIASSMRKRV